MRSSRVSFSGVAVPSASEDSNSADADDHQILGGFLSHAVPLQQTSPASRTLGPVLDEHEIVSGFASHLQGSGAMVPMPTATPAAVPSPVSIAISSPGDSNSNSSSNSNSAPMALEATDALPVFSSSSSSSSSLTPKVLNVETVRGREEKLVNALRQKTQELQKTLEKNKTLESRLQSQSLELDGLRTDLNLAQQKVNFRSVGGPRGALNPLLGLGSTDIRRDAERKRRQILLAGELLIQDVDDDDDESSLSNKAGHKRSKMPIWASVGCLSRIWQAAVQKMAELVPLRSHLQYIETHYGKGTSKFFQFSQWMFLLMVALSVLSLVANVAHVYLYPVTGISRWGSSLYPDALMFSSFSSSPHVLIYCSLMVGTIVVLLLLSVYKFVVEDRASRAARFQELADRQNKFGRLMLNCWDFNQKYSSLAQDHKLFFAEALRVALNEDRIGELQRNRTRREKIILVLRRIVGFLLIAFLITLTWLLLILLTVFNSDIQASAINSGLPGATLASGFVVPVCIAFINGVFPELVFAITDFERWDDPTFILKAQLFRLYFLRIVTLCLYMFQFYEALGGSSVSVDPSNKASTSVSTSSGACIEDSVGQEFVKLILSAWFVSKIFDFLPVAVGRLFGSSKRGIFWVSERAVELVYFDGMILCAVPFVPSIQILGCLFLFLNFLSDSVILRRFLKVPAKRTSASDLGVYMMFVYLATLVLVLADYAYVFGLRPPNGGICGPMQSQTMQQQVMAVIDSWQPSYVLFEYILLNSYVLWPVIVILLVIAVQQTFATRLTTSLVHLQEEKFARHVDNLEAIIRRQVRENGRLRREQKAIGKEF